MTVPNIMDTNDIASMNILFSFKFNAAAALFIIQACSTAVTTPDSGRLCYDAAIEHSLTTRTSLGQQLQDGSIPVLWTAGDRIILAETGKKACSYYSTEDGGGSTATFRFIKDMGNNVFPSDGEMFTALYPAESYSYLDGRHVVNIPEIQKYSSGNVCPGTMPMIADASSGNLAFKNLCGLLKLRLNTLEKDIRLLSVTISADRHMSGRIASFNGTDVTWDTTGNADAGKSVTLQCGEGTTLSSAPEDFMIVLPPAGYTGVCIQLETTDGADVMKRTYRMDDTLKVERSSVTTLTLDLARFRCDGTEDITDGGTQSALTGLNYSLLSSMNRIVAFKEGGTGSTTVKSYVEESHADGHMKSDQIPWKASFSMDGGATWSRSIPEMFREFTMSGTGGTEGEAISYSISPCETDRECLVRLSQDESGKTEDILIGQYANVIVLTFDTAAADENTEICYSKNRNIISAIFEDGSETSIPTGSSQMRLSHTFHKPGRHTVWLRPSGDATSLDNLFNTGSYSSKSKLSGADLSHAYLAGIKSLAGMFDGCSVLESCTIGKLTATALKSIRRMFRGCSSLKSVDIASLQTDNITDMSGLFYGCASLPDICLNGFSTKSATNMKEMFYGCKSLKSPDLTGFGTSSVTDMSNMFSNCSGMTQLNLESFSTENVKTMGGMFSGCTSLTSLDLSGFNTAKVENLGSMFHDCQALESVDVSHFDTAACLHMSGMFNGCRKLKALDIGSFSTDNVLYLNDMFYGCTSLAALDLSRFRTPQVKSTAYMFNGCRALASLDIRNMTAESLETARQMFSGCSSLKSVELDDFRAPNLTNAYSMFENCGAESIRIRRFSCGDNCRLYGMFYGCYFLKSLILDYFDASRAGDMTYMFGECIRLEALDLSEFRTDNVSNMRGMFMNCNSLKKLDVSGMRTSKVTDMSLMFSCKGPEELDLSMFDTGNVENMVSMFQYCTSLKRIDVSSFSLAKVTNMYGMFCNCWNLKEIRMDMAGVPASLSCEKMFYDIPSEGTLYAKGNASDSRILAELPSGWTTETF